MIGQIILAIIAAIPPSLLALAAYTEARRGHVATQSTPQATVDLINGQIKEAATQAVSDAQTDKPAA